MGQPRCGVDGRGRGQPHLHRHRAENHPFLQQRGHAGAGLRHQSAVSGASGGGKLRRQRRDPLDAPRRAAHRHQRGKPAPGRQDAQGRHGADAQAGGAGHRPQPGFPDAGAGLSEPDGFRGGHRHLRRAGLSAAGRGLPHRGPGAALQAHPPGAERAAGPGALLHGERAVTAPRAVFVQPRRGVQNLQRQPAVPRRGAHDPRRRLCRRDLRGADLRGQGAV